MYNYYTRIYQVPLHHLGSYTHCIKTTFFCFQDTVEKLAKEKIDDCMWVNLGSNAETLWKRELFWWTKQSGYSALGFLIEAFKQVYVYRAIPQWTDKIDKQHRMNFLAIWHFFRCFPPGPVAKVLWMDLTTSILLGDGWSQFSCSPVNKICPVSATWLCCSLDMLKQRYIAGWKMEELKLNMNSPWCFYWIPIEHYG